MLPKITLVTTTLNAAKYLERALESVALQDYPNLEYIVIDAGSTDATKRILDAHADLITHFEEVPGIGLYAGLQRGFDLGSGEIMGWLNADDALHRGALRLVGNLFAQEANVHWVTGLASLMDADDRVYRIYDHCYRSRLRFLRGDRRWIQQESTYWRRSLWDRAGGLDTELKLAGDFDLWFRFYQLERLCQLEGLVGAFRTHGHEQLSTANADAYLDEVQRVIAREKAKRGNEFSWFPRIVDQLIKPFARKKTAACEHWLERLALGEAIGIARRAHWDQTHGVYRITPWSGDP